MLPAKLTVRHLRSTVRRVVSAVVDELRQSADEPAQPAKRQRRQFDAARRIEMLNVYREGTSLRKVGQQFGISGSRVQQILGSMPEYAAIRDQARRNWKTRPAGARPARQGSLHRTAIDHETKWSWKEISERDEAFERLYQMRAAGKSWKDVAEAVGRSSGRSGAHATMLYMKRQSKARGRPWPIRRAN